MMGAIRCAQGADLAVLSAAGEKGLRTVSEVRADDAMRSPAVCHYLVAKGADGEAA
jgi:hypothetical protein